MFSMVRPATDPDLPWPGIFIGVFFVGSFYFSMDQVLVQRVFAAKNLNEGRLGAVFCAFLKTLNPLLIVLPGLIAKALYPDLERADDAYPMLLKNLMPVGLLGLTIAGLTAALMGHLSATYNSIATLFTRDFYLKFRPDATHERQILVGRIAVLAVFTLGAVWAPIIGGYKSLFIYLQNISAYLMMPFAFIFFFGVFWKRINAQGVLACMLVSFILCPVMMYNNQLKPEDQWFQFLNTPLLTPWLHRAMIVTVVCVVLLVVVSLLTPRPAPDKLVNTTLHCLWEEDLDQPAVRWFKDYRLWLSLVCGGTALMWYWMR
jgi:SSS family solute:Na+ symporter